jgi:hypothetical protein
MNAAYKSWHSGSLPDGGRAYGSPAKALANSLMARIGPRPGKPDAVAEVIPASAYETRIGRAWEAGSFAQSHPHQFRPAISSIHRRL